MRSVARRLAWLPKAMRPAVERPTPRHRPRDGSGRRATGGGGGTGSARTRPAAPASPSAEYSCDRWRGSRRDQAAGPGAEVHVAQLRANQAQMARENCHSLGGRERPKPGPSSRTRDPLSALTPPAPRPAFRRPCASRSRPIPFARADPAAPAGAAAAGQAAAPLPPAPPRQTITDVGAPVSARRCRCVPRARLHGAGYHCASAFALIAGRVRRALWFHRAGTQL